MSDALDAIYASKREAFDRGRHLGATDAIRRARLRISVLSSKYETDGEIAKFHAVEQCCAVLRTYALELEGAPQEPPA